MNYSQIIDKEIVYYDINGKKQTIGTIRSINDEKVKVDFTLYGRDVFRELSNKEYLERNDVFTLLKTNKREVDGFYGRPTSDIETIFKFINDTAKKGFTEVSIGDISNEDIYLRKGQFITNNESISTVFQNAVKANVEDNKESLVIKSIQLGLEGGKYVGRHVMIKAAADPVNDYKTLLEFAALETLKESGLHVPHYRLETIDERPYLVMEHFNKTKPFELNIIKDHRGTAIQVADAKDFYSTKLSYDMNDMTKCFSKKTSSMHDDNYEHTYLVAIKLANSIHDSSTLEGDIKEYVAAKKNKSQKDLMRALSFNILIGNTDMHGGNVKVLLNKPVNILTNKTDFEFAPFYDITPHSINQPGNNELLRHGKSLNTLNSEDLFQSKYSGIARTDMFKREFEEAKRMVNSYKEKVTKLLEKTPDLLNMFTQHFSKVNQFKRTQTFDGIEYDLSILDTDNRKRADQVAIHHNNFKSKLKQG
jgi:hypothetical protein